MLRRCLLQLPPRRSGLNIGNDIDLLCKCCWLCGNIDFESGNGFSFLNGASINWSIWILSLGGPNGSVWMDTIVKSHQLNHIRLNGYQWRHCCRIIQFRCCGMTIDGRCLGTAPSEVLSVALLILEVLLTEKYWKRSVEIAEREREREEEEWMLFVMKENQSDGSALWGNGILYMSAAGIFTLWRPGSLCRCGRSWWRMWKRRRRRRSGQRGRRERERERKRRRRDVCVKGRGLE